MVDIPVETSAGFPYPTHGTGEASALLTFDSTWFFARRRHPASAGITASVDNDEQGCASGIIDDGVSRSCA
jgi:hypothetical protein